ncbi:spidroin-1-like [Camelus ferus]|uniref:Spidroin-1-like n=1 Tax=Camelus ferus TaxID=419612 RepID=A0A8B8SMF0_CAMFR|nr:spidroin-1-like [Camelus ferus]
MAKRVTTANEKTAGCLPLEEGQWLGLRGRPLPPSSRPRPLNVESRTGEGRAHSPSPICIPEGWRAGGQGSRGEGRGGEGGGHRAVLGFTHTEGRSVSIRCSPQRGPSGPPDPGPHRRPLAGPTHCGARSVGVVAARGGRGGRARRAGVAPPLRLGFLPAPPPLGRNYGGPGRGRRAYSCRIPPPPFPTPSPRAVGAASCAAPARFGAAARGAGRLFAILSARRAVGIRVRSSDRRARPTTRALSLCRQVGVSWGATSSSQPAPRTPAAWRAGGDAAGAGPRGRCAAPGAPWRRGGGDRRGRDPGRGVWPQTLAGILAGEPRGGSRVSFPGARAPPSTVSVPGEGCGGAAAGEMAEGSWGGGARGGRRGRVWGGGRSWGPSGRVRGPVFWEGTCGSRVLGAVPSHRRLFDAKVSCLRGRSGDFSERGSKRVVYEDTKMKSLCAS